MNLGMIGHGDHPMKIHLNMLTNVFFVLVSLAGCAAPSTQAGPVQLAATQAPEVQAEPTQPPVSLPTATLRGAGSSE